MKYDIILVGVGGQGILSVAAIIAKAAMIDGLHVRQSEVHGMSQRGGGVQAHLRLSDTTIMSDLIPSGKADLILSMEPIECLRYLSWLKPDGIVVTASEPFVNIPNYPEIEKVYAVINALPKSLIVETKKLASQAGNAKSENIALIGAVMKYIPVSKNALLQAITERFASKDPKLVDINIKALELGGSC